jgi:hypothetical protein
MIPTRTPIYKALTRAEGYLAELSISFAKLEVLLQPITIQKEKQHEPA